MTKEEIDKKIKEEIDKKIKENEEARSAFERKKAGLKEVADYFDKLIDIAEENIKILYKMKTGERKQ